MGEWFVKRLDGDNRCFKTRREVNLPITAHLGENDGRAEMVYDFLPILDEMVAERRRSRWKNDDCKQEDISTW